MNKTKLLAFLIILITIIIGITISYSIINTKNNNNIEITDKKLNDNFIILTQTNWEHNYIIEDLFKKERIDNISNIDKLYLLLQWNYNNNSELITNDFINNYNSNGLTKDAIGIIIDENGNYTNYDNEYYIKETYIKEKYNTIFNDDYEQIKVDSFKKCPNYYYDSNYKLYFYAMYCGGIDFKQNHLYIYKTDNKDNLYNIYVAVGYSYPTDESFDSNNPNTDEWTYNIYKSYITNKIYKRLTDNEIQDFIINNSNYKEFDHFKFTFEKNNKGDYIFKSIEHIKD